MFQFTQFASLPYIFRQGYPRFTQGGLPHSEIFGSKLDWQLPEAYGSLPPPSSPLDATGIHQVPFSINHKFCWLLKHWALINTYISKIANFLLLLLTIFYNYIHKKKKKFVFGGDERIRTADLPRAKRSLCQLSYTPIHSRRPPLIFANKYLIYHRFAYDYQYSECNIGL